MTTIEEPVDAAQAPAHTPRRRFRPWMAAVIGVAAIALGAAGLAFRGPDTFTAHGTMTVTSFDTSSSFCFDGGFGDIAEGAQVTVTGGDGKTLGVGQLGAAKVLDHGVECLYRFTVPEVDGGQKFYGVHIGNSSRGTVQFSEAQMRSGPALSLQG